MRSSSCTSSSVSVILIVLLASCGDDQARQQITDAGSDAADNDAASDDASIQSRKGLHLAVNGGDYSATAIVGFNLADVASVSALDDLPESTQAVFWLGPGFNSTCEWRLSDEEVTETVGRVKNHARFSGIYYISDEPHPAKCPEAPELIKSRSDLIHELDPGAKTFIVVLNASDAPTEFELLANTADYIGVDPYPCNVNNADTGCELEKLTSRIDAALGAGIGKERVVPVFQTFGQSCTTGTSYYRLPSVAEMQDILAVWDQRVPKDMRPFDMAYSWGYQETHACPSLSMADGETYPDLQSVFAAYFASF